MLAEFWLGQNSTKPSAFLRPTEKLPIFQPVFPSSVLRCHTGQWIKSYYSHFTCLFSLVILYANNSIEDGQNCSLTSEFSVYSQEQKIGIQVQEMHKKTLTSVSKLKPLLFSVFFISLTRGRMLFCGIISSVRRLWMSIAISEDSIYILYWKYILITQVHMNYCYTHSNLESHGLKPEVPY